MIKSKILNLKNKQAFTLIELMVAIAIVAVLSSIVIASLSGSKNLSKDAVVKKELQEFEKLLFYQYSETGTYGSLQPNGYFSDAAGCDTAFGSSNYVTQARIICKKIVANTSDWNGVYMFNVGNNGSDPQKYSLMGALSTGKYFCVGISGKSETETSAYPSSGSAALGCWSNP